MIYRKRRKYVNSNKINRKKCLFKTENKAKESYNENNGVNNHVNNFNLYYWIFIFPFVTFFSFFVFSFIPINKYSIVYEYKKFNIGEKVVLKDGTEYYCINNCGSSNRDITLLNAYALDINNDSVIDERDMIAFDEDNNYLYNSSKKNNIGYILNNLKIKSNLKFIKEYRLLTSEEYVALRNKMNFGYDWDEENWLAGDSIGSWWLKSYKVKSILTVTKRGTYKLSLPKEKNFIRPVIETLKKNIE